MHLPENLSAAPSLQPAAAPPLLEIPNLPAVKASQRATWESGDFGRIAQSIEPAAEEFIAHLSLTPGTRVLDLACGTGNLAMIAARTGCDVTGVDIARNLIAAARGRAASAGLSIRYLEGDVEDLPCEAGAFDCCVSMFGTMFAPRPERVVAEMRRVTRPGGRIALASWTPGGFIGRMFGVFKAHLPAPPAGVPSPLNWGDGTVVRRLLQDGFSRVELRRRFARMCYPFPPAGTVDFFRRWYGPTLRAFASLDGAAAEALHRDLVELQTRHNVAGIPDATEVSAEYLEVTAVRD